MRNAARAAPSASRTSRGEALRLAASACSTAPSAATGHSANVGSTPDGRDGDGGATRRRQPRDEIERQERRVAGRGHDALEAVGGGARQRRGDAGERAGAAPARRIGDERRAEPPRIPPPSR